MSSFLNFLKFIELKIFNTTHHMKWRHLFSVCVYYVLQTLHLYVDTTQPIPDYGKLITRIVQHHAHTKHVRTVNTLKDYFVFRTICPPETGNPKALNRN